MPGAVNETAWIIGFAIGAAVVVVVAVLVGTILYLASKIRAQALEAVVALVEARDNTAALWRVEETNRVAEEILGAARRGRGALGG